LTTKHDTTGWPSFKGWPTHDSNTHESTYWKWIERAWRGGLRLMVNDLVENRALCEMYWLKANPCNEMVSAKGQLKAMHELQDYIDAQSGGPGKGFLRIVTSPEQARRVINDGKLALVLGIEVSEVLDCKLRGSAPKCTKAQIDQQLTELHDLGVQSAFVTHKFDNALSGTRFDSDITGVLVNIGNGYATGRWWAAESCPVGQEPDNRPPSITGDSLELFRALGMGIGKKIVNGSLPVYPPGPLCNPKGLTELGEHMIRKMAELGMIVEVDHMSVKARNQTLDLLEEMQYSGAISSHSWSDVTAEVRLQRLGGLLSPYGRDAEVYVESWKRVRSTRRAGFFGIGYGSDSNGLGAQPGPRPGASEDPVTYPYTSFDGGTTMARQQAGTRSFDVNRDGVANYGLFPDYIEDMRGLAGDQIVDDMANGAEAYLQLWERAEAW
ncbi:MAG: membrane dipeptidase, partial [Solirubrobacteraceae bacterium]|nr:membrane dipeptidase [Solirubrobacteraceae bacterium]